MAQPPLLPTPLDARQALAGPRSEAGWSGGLAWAFSRSKVGERKVIGGGEGCPRRRRRRRTPAPSPRARRRSWWCGTQRTPQPRR